MRNLGRRVLAFDENVDAAEPTTTLLESAGCLVRAAYTGEQVLADVSEFAPEMVVLDPGMPGLSGVDTCVRSARRPAERPFLAAGTGWGQDEDRRGTQSAGVGADVVKPVAPDALLNLVEDPRRP